MKLKECCTLFTDGNWIETKDQSDLGIRLIQTGNVGKGMFLEKEARAKYISEDTFEALKCTEIYPGDILISRLPDPVGRACIIPERKERMITAVDCSILRVNDDIVNRRYLLHYLKSHSYFNQVTSKLAGTTRIRISRKNLEQIVINVPEIIEQEKVAKVLDSIEYLIQMEQKELELYEILINSKFEEIFGDRFVNNLNWPTKKLGDCMTFNNGKAHEQVIDENGEYILVTSRAISSDLLDVRRTNLLLVPLHKNDVVMVMSDVPNGKALAKCLLIDEDNKYTMNQRICSFDNYEFNPVFLVNLLNRHQYFLSFDDGNGQTNLRKNDILECELIVPPIALQNQFAAFVQQVDQLKSKTQKSLDKTQLLFNSLMQQYFG